MTMDHKSAVESLLFMPNGGMFLSSGGTDIKARALVTFPTVY